MQLEIAVLSKAGGREVNEDACDYWSAAGACCCVLSDGLGGHYGGDVASKLVVQHALDCFRMAPECSVQVINTLLRASDDAIIQKQLQDNKLRYMCATAVVLTIDTKRHIAAWGHIGDSRLYCFRQGRIIAQTRDHSVTQSMVDAGYLKPEELRLSPNRNKLFAALGTSEQFDADIVSSVFPVQDRDAFLLCSDGLWEYVEENVMERTLAASTSASGWLKELERQVLERGHKGQDNYSAISVWCGDQDKTIQFAKPNKLL